MSEYLKKTGFVSLILFSLVLFYPRIGWAVDRSVLDIDVHLSSGFREDHLNWNIAGSSDGTAPNILSELIWRDLVSFQLKGLVKAVLFERIFLRLAMQGGPIFSGSVTDSDFNGDNRTLEFSRSDNSSERGSVWDVSGGLGYKLTAPLFSGSLEVIPLFGADFHQQNLTLMDGFQTIPHTGYFKGLNSTYSARWTGPWLGTDLSYTIEKFIFRFSGEYHYIFYQGFGNWNLRSVFAHPLSFKHTAEGSGFTITSAIEYALKEHLGLSLDFEYTNFETGPGNDRTFFANGIATDTQLNIVNWNSVSLMLGIFRSF